MVQPSSPASWRQSCLQYRMHDSLCNVGKSNITGGKSKSQIHRLPGCEEMIPDLLESRVGPVETRACFRLIIRQRQLLSPRLYGNVSINAPTNLGFSLEVDCQNQPLNRSRGFVSLERSSTKHSGKRQSKFRSNINMKMAL